MNLRFRPSCWKLQIRFWLPCFESGCIRSYLTNEEHRYHIWALKLYFRKVVTMQIHPLIHLFPCHKWPSKTLQYLNITVENCLELAVGRWKLNKGSVRWALKRNKSEPCGWKDSFLALSPHKEIVRVSMEVLVRAEFPSGYVGVYFLWPLFVNG